MMLKGFGEAAIYGPTDAQLGVPVSPAISGPFGSVGDQYATCIQAGGDPDSCALAVIQENPAAGAAVRSNASGSSGKMALLAALVFFGVVVLRTR